MFHEEIKSADVANGSNSHVILTSSIAGAVAGASCELLFFPLDTLKTRLQSQHGFIKSGGFRNLYRGINAVLLGSGPGGAAFFMTYEGIKAFCQPHISPEYHMFLHMTAASSAEMVACLIRVPMEVLKQRKQAFLPDKTRLNLTTLYRGYGSTVLRDVPFGFIQMPLWEYFKLHWKQQVNRDCTPFEVGFCGFLSVAISAALTTPLDVAKTRIMLSSTCAEKEEVKISTMLKEVYKEGGVKGLFAGFAPRVCGFSLGGFVFFWVYERTRELCITFLINES